MRPLGCPKPEWRILTKAITECLTRVVAPSLSPNQYGFIPGRNLMQAWEEILSRLTPKCQLFEFDLKACFNKINLKVVHEELKEMGLPIQMVNYITLVNMSFPGLKKLEIEEEIIKEYSGTGTSTVYVKDGLPQGLP